MRKKLSLRSTEAYLEETSWYFALKEIDRASEASSEIWVAEDWLCNAGGSQEYQCCWRVLKNVSSGFEEVVEQRKAGEIRNAVIFGEILYDRENFLAW